MREPLRVAIIEWGEGDTADDWSDVVRRADVDAVDICAPNRLHAAIAVAAAQAGKHVLVEKPIATTLAEADTMIETAAAAGVVLATAQVGRYAAGIRAAARAVASGRVGRVRAIDADWAHGGPRTWAPAAEWFFRRDEAGGGALIDLGVHAVDAIRAVTGEEFAEVLGMIGDVRGDVEFEAHLLCRLDGGAVACVRASWAAPYGPDRHLAVWGSEAQIVVRGAQATLRSPGGAEAPLAVDGQGGSLYADFVAACRGEATALPTGRDGRAALAAVLAGYESARRGGAISPA
jgi:UDP-N-acetylglucosamine 3-dehydrogenase